MAMNFRSRASILCLAVISTALAAQPGFNGSQIKPDSDFPFDPSRKHDRDFRPSGGMRKLSENLFLFEDTCNVYLVKSGNHGLLIGFGSGDILGRLRDAGVEKIDRVLLTHHHRNQAQGLVDLKSSPFLVTVPAQEARFFEDVESFWRDVRLYLNYDCRSHWNTLRKSVHVDEKVKPGDVIDWRGLQFKVIETPGVTDHAVSYAADIDGRRTMFCGELISGEGKVSNWFDLHWDYYGFTQGMDASEASFSRILAEHPSRLLPAHGAPMDDPAAAMEANRRVYATLKEMLVPNELHRVQHQVRQILPHLVFLGATSYAILSESGKAFLWDYGYVERERVAELKKQFNVKRIDAVSFSHYHDDHTIRAWELTWEDAHIWVHESMLDVLENPTRYRALAWSPCRSGPTGSSMMVKRSSGRSTPSSSFTCRGKRSFIRDCSLGSMARECCSPGTIPGRKKTCPKHETALWCRTTSTSWMADSSPAPGKCFVIIPISSALLTLRNIHRRRRTWRNSSRGPTGFVR